FNGLAFAFAGQQVNVQTDFANAKLNVSGPRHFHGKFGIRRDQGRSQRAFDSDFQNHGFEHAVPESPVPTQLPIFRGHGFDHMAAEIVQAASSIDDSLIGHEPFFGKSGKTEG